MACPTSRGKQPPPAGGARAKHSRPAAASAAPPGTCSSAREIAAASDPREKARIFAAHLRETTARTAAVQGVIESAAATDADMAQLWTELMDQLIRGMTMAVTALHAQGALRPDLTLPRAADRLWWYAGPWAYRGLVLARGWSLD